MIDVPYFVLSYVVTKIDDVSKSNIERMAIRLFPHLSLMCPSLFACKAAKTESLSSLR